jgi:hypothetical protein
MIAEKSRRAILVYAMLVVRTIALGAPAPLAAGAVHVPGNHMARSGVQVGQVDCTPPPQAAQVHQHVHDPFRIHVAGVTSPSSLAVTVLT